MDSMFSYCMLMVPSFLKYKSSKIDVISFASHWSPTHCYRRSEERRVAVSVGPVSGGALTATGDRKSVV